MTCAWVWKGLIILGLIMGLAGLLLLIDAKILRDNDESGKKRKLISVAGPAPGKEATQKLGYILTFLGYGMQILGVVLS